jgi:hypothetical protein
MFDLMLRGYNRKQVDDYLGVLAVQLGELRVIAQREQRRAERAESETRSIREQIERQNAELAAVKADLATARDTPKAQAPAPESSLGYRVEKLLRTAENEAADVRASAVREATALLERAKQEAESHRHEVERSLITRGVALEQEAAQRAAELDERTAELAKNLESAKAESEQLIVDARAAAEQLRQEAQVQLEQERQAVEAALRDQRLAAEGELARLNGLHTEVRGQLARLLDSLAGEFAEPPHPRHALRRPGPHLARTFPLPTIPPHSRTRPEPCVEQPADPAPSDVPTSPDSTESQTQAIPTEAA